MEKEEKGGARILGAQKKKNEKKKEERKKRSNQAILFGSRRDKADAPSPFRFGTPSLSNNVGKGSNPRRKKWTLRISRSCQAG